MSLIKKVLIAYVLLFWIGFGVTAAEAADLPVTSPFGWRIHPITGEWKFHSGVDLGYDYGAGVPALFDGLVMMAGDYRDGYGNQVVLYHEGIDAYTRYAHMGSILVGIGSMVMQGDWVGTVGSTGISTGPHLHLEYIVRGMDGYEYANPLILWE